MENKNQILISESNKELFRTSAQWMRTFAIFMIIGLSFISILILILSADRNGELIKAIAEKSEGDIGIYLEKTLGILLIGASSCVVLYGYASLKLLSAANRFTALSFSTSTENLVQAFKNLRLFWMFYGVTLIFIILMGIVFFVKMYSLAASQTQG